MPKWAISPTAGFGAKLQPSPARPFLMSSTPLPPALVRFGVFEADLRAGELRRNGVRVRLQDLPFRALKLLLSRPGEVIAREEFRQALWPPDIFVDFEQGISSAVMRLRDALGDSAAADVAASRNRQISSLEEPGEWRFPGKSFAIFF